MGYVFTTGDDHVLQSIADIEEPVLILIRDISRAEPSITIETDEALDRELCGDCVDLICVGSVCNQYKRSGIIDGVSQFTTREAKVQRNEYRAQSRCREE